MVSSWRRKQSFTQELELEDTLKPKDLEDIQVLVKEKVPDKQECQLRSFGSEDKESSEDYWESTEPLRRSIELFTESST